ncbi:MAG: protein kinase [Labilithrix sp.]|nr:protein kinase [Labilithrix sp.]
MSAPDPEAKTQAASFEHAPARLTSPEEAPPLLGGRYELLGMLGAGAMGTVYRARDRELDEVVALKMLKKELASADMVERFRREVKLARRVTHKNVARTYDIGEDGGDRFLTMEFIEGEMLAALLARRGKLPVAEVVTLGLDVCAGLAAAHAAGVLHRDLKPENVIVAKDGRTVITDFGIARAYAQQELSRTAAGIVGTPAYMAPEQVEGAADLDARADLYALGAMLYELLTGQMAWQGDTIVTVAAGRLLRPPPDARATAPEVPGPVAALVLKLMARRREDRVASAEDTAAPEAPRGRRRNHLRGGPTSGTSPIAPTSPRRSRRAAGPEARAHARRARRRRPPRAQPRAERRRVPRREPERGRHRPAERRARAARQAARRHRSPRRREARRARRRAVPRRGRRRRRVAAAHRRHGPRLLPLDRGRGRLPALGEAVRPALGGGPRDRRRRGARDREGADDRARAEAHAGGGPGGRGPLPARPVPHAPRLAGLRARGARRPVARARAGAGRRPHHGHLRPRAGAHVRPRLLGQRRPGARAGARRPRGRARSAPARGEDRAGADPPPEPGGRRRGPSPAGDAARGPELGRRAGLARPRAGRDRTDRRGVRAAPEGERGGSGHHGEPASGRAHPRPPGRQRGDARGPRPDAVAPGRHGRVVRRPGARRDLAARRGPGRAAREAARGRHPPEERPVRRRALAQPAPRHHGGAGEPGARRSLAPRRRFEIAAPRGVQRADARRGVRVRPRERRGARCAARGGRQRPHRRRVARALPAVPPAPRAPRREGDPRSRGEPRAARQRRGRLAVERLLIARAAGARPPTTASRAAGPPRGAPRRRAASRARASRAPR